MPEATVTLRNASGLHARPAKVFARSAAASSGDVVLVKGGKEVNAKSVLSVLTLDCRQGDEILIRTTGDGAEEVLAKLVGLVEAGLGDAEHE
ncbi:MAG: HPr family phosphocarrier protein [Actinomycetota bacterium]